MGNVDTKEESEVEAEPNVSRDSNKRSISAAVLAKKSSHLKDTLVDDFSAHKSAAQHTKSEFTRELDQDRIAEDHFRHNKQRFDNLLAEELEIRGHVGSMPGAQGKGGLCNVVGSSIINMIAAFLIFVFYLISLEALLSIGLSVGMTICKLCQSV